MNTLTIRTENPNLLSLVKDFLKKYKEIEIIEDEISEDKLKIYLENIREKANQENTIDSNEMKDKFFQKLCELDTQKKQRNLLIEIAEFLYYRWTEKEIQDLYSELETVLENVSQSLVIYEKFSENIFQALIGNRKCKIIFHS